jgi:hypothetical protein
MDIVENALVYGVAAALFTLLISLYQFTRDQISIRRAMNDPASKLQMSKLNKINKEHYKFSKSLVADMADVVQKKEYVSRNGANDFDLLDFHLVFMTVLFSKRVNKYFVKGDAKHKIAGRFGEDVKRSRQILIENSIATEAILKSTERELLHEKDPIRAMILIGK